MKKLLSLILVIFILCGCGAEKINKPSEATPRNTPLNTPQSTPEATLKPAKKSLPDVDVSSLSDKQNGWGYRKMKEARPEFTDEQITQMDKYGCIYMGKEDSRKLYLTFDEGYENGYTALILDTLKEKNVKAAFFITGPYLKENTELVDRMVAEGHIVGNHTVNHPSLPGLSAQELEDELIGLDRVFFSRYGKAMKYLRPPKGEYSEKTLYLSSKLGYTNVFWSFAYKDWEKDAHRGKEYALKEVTSGLHGGIVILLHAVSKDNAEALGDIIDNAKSMGYSFALLDEYER